MFKKRLLLPLTAAAVAGLLLGSSCFSQGSVSSFFDAGANSVEISGGQMSQYVFYRFETSEAGHTLTLPSAADIISQMNSPVTGQLFAMAVTAEGANSVTITGGVGVSVKLSAAEVSGNTTKNIYFIVTNTSSGTQAITVY